MTRLPRLDWRVLAVTGVVSVAAHAAVLVALIPAVAPVQIAGGAPGTVAALGNAFDDFTQGAQRSLAATVQAQTPDVTTPVAVQPVQPLQPSRARTATAAALATPVAPQPAAAASVLAGGTPPPVAATATALQVAPAGAVPRTEPEPAPDVIVQQATPDTPRPAPRPAAHPVPQPVPQPAQTAGNADRTTRRGSADGAQGSATAAAPQAATAATTPGNAEVSNYPGQVMRRIQRVRQARVRARGTAVVAFTVAGDGGLASVRLARASGSADLDAAALDHIRRAAPFPVPPPGAQRNFSFEFVGR